MMQCSDLEKVLLAEFSLKFDDQVWQESMRRVLAKDRVPITWDTFKMEFEKKYIPNVVQDKKAVDFVQLAQRQMIDLACEAKFSNLLRYTPQIINTKREKA